MLVAIFIMLLVIACMLGLIIYLIDNLLVDISNNTTNILTYVRKDANIKVTQKPVDNQAIYKLCDEVKGMSNTMRRQLDKKDEPMIRLPKPPSKNAIRTSLDSEWNRPI